MKKSKILIFLIAISFIFTLSACGSKKGEASFANFESIVVLSTEAGAPEATTYNGLITLMGVPTDSTNYSTVEEDGYLVWEDTEEGYYVKVVLEDNKVVEKEQTGLYRSVYERPIGTKTGVWEWIIKMIGYFTYYASNLFGLLGDHYFYWIGLLLMTLLIRTLGWPIYAKSNDMTLKMQLAQPEINRIQEKYRGRTDQASQQRMQLETMELYKKYKINIFGCLMPLLQMPIFIAMYQVVQRFPLDTSVFGDATVNTGFLWTDLMNKSLLPNLPLALIVVVTMFLSNWLMQRRTKMNQKHNRNMDAKAQQSQKMMKFMMYFMMLMMGYIAIGNAGIAFYWIIGNCYQLFQSYISQRGSLKRQEQLKSKF
ncbi:MAG: YidC/Oxa1 family membrane protein insertase [Candidatus Izemoplasmatales bacterium]|jgi:YidC/Oxa1 family membrane protein insertase|nr:YidC/Oxa1 family membrane protein insertase [Candidatus Izemoplasmatales bacterium]NLF48598.1 YidC/Oxa1 family membrane protein insertase [Acholeplasmataceae bacterium]MDD4354396.1 YidC/Oxa1 family membrane protein insertase [Candidatus Izemoplasmatales bacterium]MDD4987487.1 YidC/Oxa1 family membrane protein insertase [Candidatus Izemoplasmatales bacterium]MDD5601808.1 YidC/Oxa1 family membrane protein insertase [Candidatus Izemoplasmatales bacterium]